MDKNLAMKRNLTAISVAAGIGVAAAVLGKALRARRSLTLDGKIALVTGGSRGLGLLIAGELGRQGATVVLVARDEDELRAAQQTLGDRNIDAAVLSADVREPAEAKRIVDEVVARHGRLDVLVNNAGVIIVGPRENMGLADFEEALAVHFWGPFHTMRAAIPHMRAAGGGRIVNISSIGGKVAVPHLGPYSASKFALTGLSNAMRAELARDGILVTTVCPGLMRTGSVFNAWFKGRHRQEFTWFAVSGSLPLITVDAHRAAWQIVDAAKHGDAELIVGWPARLMVAAAGIAPNALAGVMALANRILPAPDEDFQQERRSGWQSASKWAPSVLTRMSEQPAIENNELPTPARP
jgi:NAD(P)-dependent dehydrogenase (short-subunit alcohol dehydrogenase family)